MLSSLSKKIKLRLKSKSRLEIGFIFGIKKCLKQFHHISEINYSVFMKEKSIISIFLNPSQSAEVINRHIEVKTGDPASAEGKHGGPLFPKCR
jgi:hypothetical protein